MASCVGSGRVWAEMGRASEGSCSSFRGEVGNRWRKAIQSQRSWGEVDGCQSPTPGSALGSVTSGKILDVFVFASKIGIITILPA